MRVLIKQINYNCLVINEEKNMPMDKDTLVFLVEEAINNAFQDCKENLEKLSSKYGLEIKVKAPQLVEVVQTKDKQVIWLKE
jgi:DNA-binding protein YbaB